MLQRIQSVVPLITLLLLLLLTPCALNGCADKMFSETGNARHTAVFAVRGKNAAAADTSSAAGTPQSYIELRNAGSYAEKFNPPDMLTETAKALVAASDNGIAFTNAKNNYSRGEKISLTVAGSPNTLYTLKIRYKSGYSSALGLGGVTSDNHGYATWTFKIGNVSGEFIPWFEVTGGGVTVTHKFTVGGDAEYSSDTSSENSSHVTAAPSVQNENAAETAALPKEKINTSAPATAAPETEPPGTKIIFINARSKYARGEAVTLTITGEPNAVYTLKVKYKSGYSSAKGLGETKSDARGNASWAFKISSNADTTFTPFFEVTGGGRTEKWNFKLTNEVTTAPTTKTPKKTTPVTEPPATIPPVKTAPETTGLETSVPETDNSAAAENDNAVNGIKFIDAKAAYKRGEAVTLTINGEPDMVYTLKIKYKTGYSTAKGLGEAKSDANGSVAWTFKIGSRVSTTDFVPYFEITGGNKTTLLYFNMTD